MTGDPLLAPIPGPDPAGRDVRDTGDYARIAEARRDEKAGLPRGVWERDVKQADWALVERLCGEVLVERSKDLRIACWLTEAWVHRRGFEGLARGLALVDGLVRDYWEGLFPLLEGADPSARTGAIDWLNDRLPIALRQIPVVMDAQGDTSYTWSDYMAAARLDQVRLQDAAAAKKAEAGGAVTLAMVDACRDRTETATFTQLIADLEQAHGGLASLDTRLDALCGRDAPGLGRIRGVIEDVADFATGARAMRQEVLPATDSAVVAPEPQPTARTIPALSSRDAAYRQIAAIADYLRGVDPHSPVPDVLAIIASWGGMSLQDIDNALQNGDSNVSILLGAIGYIVTED